MAVEEESCSVMAVGVLVSAGTFSGLLELKWVSVWVYEAAFVYFESMSSVIFGEKRGFLG